MEETIKTQKEKEMEEFEQEMLKLGEVEPGKITYQKKAIPVSSEKRTFTAEDVKTILDQMGKILDIHSVIIDAIIPERVAVEHSPSEPLFIPPLGDDSMTPLGGTAGKP